MKIQALFKGEIEKEKQQLGHGWKCPYCNRGFGYTIKALRKCNEHIKRHNKEFVRIQRLKADEDIQAELERRKTRLERELQPIALRN